MQRVFWQNKLQKSTRERERGNESIKATYPVHNNSFDEPNSRWTIISRVEWVVKVVAQQVNSPSRNRIKGGWIFTRKSHPFASQLTRISWIFEDYNFAFEIFFTCVEAFFNKYHIFKGRKCEKGQEKREKRTILEESKIKSQSRVTVNKYVTLEVTFVTSEAEE